MADRPKKLTLQDTLESQRENKSRRKSQAEERGGLSAFFSWMARICVLFAICSSPWMIASVNPGAQLILAVALLLGVSCWWIESGLSSKKRQVIPYVVLLVFLGMGIGFFQTLALPSWLSEMAAGKQIEIAEKYLASEDGVVSPIRLSLDVEGTWHQLRLLVIAISSLLLASRYFRTASDLSIFLTTILVNGVAITAFGLVQKFRFNGKLFWEIELTRGGIPFGPFVCRNNAAGYLVMCLAAGAGLLLLLMTKKEVSRPHQIVSKEIPVWRQMQTYVAMFVAELDAKRIAVIIACVFISIGVVATLSRGGVMALFAATIGGAIIYNITRKPKFAGILLAPIALLVIGLACWVGFSEDLVARFEKIDTLGESTIDARLNTWRDTLPAAADSGWLGAGLGSYESVHRLYRSDPETKLFLHAENQYVQSLVEAGIPGLSLLLLALLLSLWYVFFLLKRGSSGLSIGAGVFGACLIVGQVVAAAFDFGWYIPANMVLYAAGIGVVGFHAHSLAGRLKKKSLLRFEMPSLVSQLVILAVFLFGIFAVYSLYNQSAIYEEVRPASLALRSPRDVDMAETEKRIQGVSAVVNNSPTTDGLNMLGDLYLHRARLQYFELLKSGANAELGGEGQETVDSNLWNLTGLVRICEYVSTLKRQRDFGLLRSFQGREFFQVDLPQALIYYRASQKMAPLQPRIQLAIGGLSASLEDYSIAAKEIEKAIELSPKNADFRFSAALLCLQCGDNAMGAEHLGVYLDLEPRQFPNVLDIATGKSTRQILPLENEVIFETVIGDNAEQLYRFGRDFLESEPRLKRAVLRRADELLVDISMSDSERLKLKADINFEAGNAESGINYLQAVVRSNPNDQKSRLLLARTLLTEGLLREAKEQVEKLLRINKNSRQYLRLFKEIDAAIEKKKESDSQDLGINQVVPKVVFPVTVCNLKVI